MKLLAFYLITCAFMAFSTWLSGLQWTGANGIGQFLNLIFRDKPLILAAAVSIFVLSGIHMHVGKSFFSISYFENGIIWLSSSWVSFLILWAVYGLVPNKWEVVGLVLGQAGLFAALVGRAASA
ncbi:MAG: hypothetical protein FWF99_07660 [Desulfovibrionaceae bacterium]|nr:hypothetical protein [Desulfovibrionaceae bacterium]